MRTKWIVRGWPEWLAKTCRRYTYLTWVGWNYSRLPGGDCKRLWHTWLQRALELGLLSTLMMVQSAEWQTILTFKNSLGFQFAYWKFNTDMTKNGLDKIDWCVQTWSFWVSLHPSSAIFAPFWFMSSSLVFPSRAAAVWFERRCCDVWGAMQQEWVATELADFGGGNVWISWWR